MPLQETRSRLVKWLTPRRADLGTGSVPLEIECHIHSCFDALIPSATVVDGLDGFCESGIREAIEEANPRMKAPARSIVKDIELVAADNAHCRNHDLLFAEGAVRSQHELKPPDVREIPIPRLQWAAKVRMLTILKDADGARCGSVACGISAGDIHDGTAKVRTLPLVRRSVNLASIKTNISVSFLREAAAIKGIKSGAGELLAVFRSIPLAMISRVCFLEERGVLLYTISSAGGPSVTRVHDLAAVRDRTTGKTRLVPHKTKYTTAFLN